jgi:hypothetical protein
MQRESSSRKTVSLHQDFILHAIGEVFVLFFRAQIFKGQHGDTFVRHVHERARRSPAPNIDECSGDCGQ